VDAGATYAAARRRGDDWVMAIAWLRPLEPPPDGRVRLTEAMPPTWRDLVTGRVHDLRSARISEVLATLPSTLLEPASDVDVD
jgi:hypothetical protein